MNRLTMASPGLLLLLAAVACDDGLLDIRPQDEIAEEIAIIDEASAQSALVGAYDGLQGDGGAGYAGDLVVWMDLLTDDVEHTGTFGSYATADLLTVTADNASVTGIWQDAYEGINRVNILVEKVPTLEDFDPVEADRILGEAFGIRALHYFNLVRAYGGVPVVLVSPTLEEAPNVTRASVAETYAAIEADLNEAEARLDAAQANNGVHTFITPGFIDALQAQVHLTQGEWTEAEAEAMEVVNSGEYSLAGSYADLFTPEGAPTAEDIFRVEFIATDANIFGFYYQFEGRFETGATEEIYSLYDQADDERFATTFDEIRPDGIEVVKYPTTVGTEDVHVIRYAELLLILAEAHAQQGELADALTYLNQVRTRAGLAAYTSATLDTQERVLDAIYLERRLELAFEGERWFDLVRTGRVVSEIGDGLPSPENLLPIPVSELDVTEMPQNPGYEQ
jgi:hypothetical protein